MHLNMDLNGHFQKRKHTNGYEHKKRVGTLSVEHQAVNIL